MENNDKWNYKLIIWILISLRITTQLCSAQQGEGKSLPSVCPALTRPHLTQCNKYYRCLMLPSNQHIWVVTNCEEGLIFDDELGVCVLSNTDWECNLSTDSYNKTQANDDSNVYGVNNLSLDMSPTTTTSTSAPELGVVSYLDSDSATYPAYEQNDMSDYEEPEIDDSMEQHAGHADVEYQNSIDPLPTFVVNNESEKRKGASRYEVMLSSGTNRLDIKPSSYPFAEDIESNESSGDGYENNEIQRKDNSVKLPKDGTLIEKLQKLAQLVREIERINERTSSEENLTRVDQDFLALHLLRIKQANKNTLNIVKLPMDKEENVSLEDISNILKHQKIDKDGAVNSTTIKHTRIKASIKPNSSPRPYLSRDPFTKIELIATPADLEQASKLSSYSNNQVVVNRPEGSVVFNVPASRPAPPPPPKVKNPTLSEDMLKTILELSQQLVHTSKENAARNPEPVLEKVNSQTHTVLKPIYITVPVPMSPIAPTSHITITNNDNKYQGSQEKSGEDKRPSLLTKADFEQLNQTLERLPQQVYYDSYGEKHVIFGPSKSEANGSPEPLLPPPDSDENFVLLSTSHPRISTTTAPSFQQPSRESFESGEHYSSEKSATSGEKVMSTEEVPFPIVKPTVNDQVLVNSFIHSSELMGFKGPEQEDQENQSTTVQNNQQSFEHTSAEKRPNSAEKTRIPIPAEQSQQQPSEESIEQYSAERLPVSAEKMRPPHKVQSNGMNKRPEKEQPSQESFEHASGEKRPTSNKRPQQEQATKYPRIPTTTPPSHQQPYRESFEQYSAEKRPIANKHPQLVFASHFQRFPTTSAPSYQQPNRESFEQYSGERRPTSAEKKPPSHVNEHHTPTSFVYSSQLNGWNKRPDSEQQQSQEKTSSLEQKRPTYQAQNSRPVSQEIPFPYVSPLSEEFPERPASQDDPEPPMQGYGERIPEPVRIAFPQHEEFDNLDQPSGYSHATRPAPAAKYPFQTPPSYSHHHHHPYPMNAVNSQIYQPDNQNQQNYYVVDQPSGEHNQNYKLVIPKAPASAQKKPEVYNYEQASIEQAFAPIKKKYGGMEYASSPYYQGKYGPSAAPVESEELDSTNAAYSDDDESENVAAETMDESPLDNAAPDVDDDQKLVSLAGAYINYSAYKKAVGNKQNIPVSVLQCAVGVRQANTTDCTKYYICNPSNKQVVGFDCPHYTAFNADTKMCDAPTYARCRPAVITEITIEDNKNSEMMMSLEQPPQQVPQIVQVTPAPIAKKPPARVRNRLKTKNPQRLRRPLTTTTTTTERPSTTTAPRRKVKKPLKNKTVAAAGPSATRTVSRPSCRRPGKLADPLDESKYILCFKNEQGVMKRHTLACAGNLVFCKRYSLCTRKARCVES